MKIGSKKAATYRKVALLIGIAIAIFYVLTLTTQMADGYAKWTDTMWNFIYFSCFALFVGIIFPSNHFEFQQDTLSFRPAADFRRRKVKLSEIDYIYYKPEWLLLETKTEKKYEISLKNFDENEEQKLKQKFAELGIRELQD
jgi:hypothetical protein